MAAKPKLTMHRTGAGDQGARKAKEHAAATAVANETPRRVKMTLSVPEDLLRELRVIASTLPPAVFPSISGAIVEATQKAVEELREAHNEGEPFTSDTKPVVRTGRRPGV